MTAESDPDYYRTLQVQPDAHHSVIRAAYYQLAKLHHPDVSTNKGASTAAMQLINQAYETLKDPHARANYDRIHRLHTWPSTAADYIPRPAPRTPAAPHIISARRSSRLFNDHITLTWNPPQSAQPITAYELQMLLLPKQISSTWQSAAQQPDKSASSITLKRIHIYTRYCFRIRAFTATGPGPWSKTFREPV